MTIFRAAMMTALLLGPVAWASGAGGALLGASATCNCRGAGDCTCPRGQCKCKKCNHGQKLRLIDALRDAPTTTRLPDAARHDARGGVFI